MCLERIICEDQIERDKPLRLWKCFEQEDDQLLHSLFQGGTAYARDYRYEALGRSVVLASGEEAYQSGFHAFVCEQDAHDYLRQNNDDRWDSVVLPVEIWGKITIGLQREWIVDQPCDIACIVGQWMKIPSIKEETKIINEEEKNNV